MTYQEKFEEVFRLPARTDVMPFNCGKIDLDCKYCNYFDFGTGKCCPKLFWDAEYEEHK